MRYTPNPPRDWGMVDQWAVNVVVYEGKPMNLSLEERVLAVHRMEARGLNAEEMARRMGVDDRVIYRYRKYQVPPELMSYDHTHGHAMS